MTYRRNHISCWLVFMGVLVVCFLLAWTVRQARAEFTFDGEFNPSEMLEWETVQEFPCPAGYDDIHQVRENPDLKSPVKTVTLITLPFSSRGGSVVAYFYTKNGVRFRFVFDSERARYVQVEPIPTPKTAI